MGKYFSAEKNFLPVNILVHNLCYFLYFGLVPNLVIATTKNNKMNKIKKLKKIK